MNSFFVLSAEVKAALEQNKPIVALESTIITHGMPYPQNLETALHSEEIIRQNGCTPATIAVIQGKRKIGLNKDELTYLAKKGQQVLKASRRDIPYLIVEQLDGATTVSGTMFLANQANIKVFATGGIGGVHRNAEETFDISTDLDELAQTSVAVVCSGAKSILDIGKTLEWLETKAVPIIGYQTSTFPLFYSAQSEYPVPYRFDSSQKIAEFLKTKWESNLNGGIIIANPIPQKWELDSEWMEEKIQSSIQTAQNKKIRGKDVTPFLLQEIGHLTGNVSLQSNIQLVYNNCLIASFIAKDYHAL